MGRSLEKLMLMLSLIVFLSLIFAAHHLSSLKKLKETVSDKYFEVKTNTLASNKDVSGLWQEIDEKILQLSEHPDIDVRGKFQKQRIGNLCRTHFFSREQHLPTKSPEAWWFHRHLVFEERTHSMYCFVPKIGSTNMRRLMYYMGGHLPIETIDMPYLDDIKYLKPALDHASLMNKKLTNSQRMHIIRNYYKFMVVRNPLERLLSSYRDKIKPPIDYKKRNIFPHTIKLLILQRYKLQEYMHWKASPKSTRTDSNITFSDFIRYVIETTSEELNEHFQPSFDICHPCLVHYDFYPNLKTISHDSQALIKKFQTNPRFYKDQNYHIKDSNTSQLLHHYYSQLSPREKVKLLGTMYDDLLFYYALYPSERHSHRTLLGVDHAVL